MSDKMASRILSPKKEGIMSAFSYDDLARWKKDLAKVKDPYAFPDVKALLHRLECAEKALAASEYQEANPYFEAWLKAKGEK